MCRPFSNPDDARSADVRDRRRNERRPVFATAIIWLGVNQQIKVRVIDESERGLALHVPFEIPYRVGLKVRIERSGEKRWATIRNLTESDNGYLRVGLSCDS